VLFILFYEAILMFLAKLKAAIEHTYLLERGDRVLVGVSGGADSLCLLDALHKLASGMGWEIFAAHLDHQFRGEESAQDAAFVQDFCALRNIPCRIEKKNLPEIIQATRLSPEHAARIVRYNFFHETAELWKISKLALAHHANDQAETVLMRVLRGTGTWGLAGIPLSRQEKSLTIIRPLLSFYKEELEKYCAENGLVPRLDSSNLKTIYRRNFLRLKVIPLLEQEVNPALTDALVHLADIADKESDYLDIECKKTLKEIIKWKENNKIIIKGKLFLACHLALQRRMIKLIFSYLLDQCENIGFAHVNQLIRWVHEGRPTGQLDLPGGIKVIKEYEEILFLRDDLPLKIIPYHYEVTVPAKLYIKEWNGWIATKISSAQHAREHSSNNVAHFDANQLQGKLTVRNRQNGDRMSLHGMCGTKKVKDLFIDAKIPFRIRDTLPIVLAGDKIIWIPGVKRSNEALVDSGTKNILTIHIEMPQMLKQLGGSHE
jgi:tRNA(Ile)-lysidine synthase